MKRHERHISEAIPAGGIKSFDLLKIIGARYGRAGSLSLLNGMVNAGKLKRERRPDGVYLTTPELAAANRLTLEPRNQGDKPDGSKDRKATHESPA